MQVIGKTLRKQWQLFCLAVMFFTRLPVPRSTSYSHALMNQANRYFSLVGLLLALLLAVFYQLLTSYLPSSVSVILLMIFSVALTGAFHEDGLADMADGIGGGMSPEKRLSIMKDSRLGTYGTITLMLTLALKFALWSHLAALSLILPSIFLAYSLSRALSSSLIFNTPYVSDTDTSKSKPLASKQTLGELLIGVLFGILPLYLFIDIAGFGKFIAALAFTLVVFRSTFRYWLIKRIGGFTGDCLGAAQQISELLIYVVIIVFSPALTEALSLPLAEVVK
ncbi:adenosylcobinamide-GDP ribazoletransferase [Thalassotalea ganghwensis]